MGRACGSPECGVSTGICERLTFGRGKLDFNGYWEIPCRPCARAEERRTGEEAWPTELCTCPDDYSGHQSECPYGYNRRQLRQRREALEKTHFDGPPGGQKEGS